MTAFTSANLPTTGGRAPEKLEQLILWAGYGLNRNNQDAQFLRLGSIRTEPRYAVTDVLDADGTLYKQVVAVIRVDPDLAVTTGVPPWKQIKEDSTAPISILLQG